MAVEADEEHVIVAVWLTVITEPVVIGVTIKTGAVDLDTDTTTEAVADEEDVWHNSFFLVMLCSLLFHI